MIKAAIIGASGYSGAELIRLLAKRDDITVAKITAHAAAGKKVTDVYPQLAGISDLSYSTLDEINGDSFDVVFFALPSGEAMSLCPEYLTQGMRVIDLGGDFRLSDADTYMQYYGTKHTSPELLGTAVYGLPEIFKKKIAESKLIANPGCYPTSVILALYPAVCENIIQTDGIVINSLSGVSGAGRKASVNLNFSEVNENIRAYKPIGHQHIPEIREALHSATGIDLRFSFVPHLIPITRGIYTTIHASLHDDLKNKDVRAIMDLYRSYYDSKPFVRVVDDIPQIKNVVFTNYCDLYITFQSQTNQLIIISVIDNLIKGAAGQAIQNMNLLFGLHEETGLL